MDATAAGEDVAGVVELLLQEENTDIKVIVRRAGVELLLPGGRLDACWLERTRLRSGLARRLSGHDEQPRRAGARAQMAV